MTVHRYVLIRGRVQGVGYRAWIEVTALERGLQGWVRNRRDGSVEALFSGAGKRGAGDARCLPFTGRPEPASMRIDQREAAAGEVALRRRDELFSVLGTV